MKYIYIIIAILFVLLSKDIQAQSGAKILFDARKAETAGNADWIIDADSHNIYFNTR